VSSAPGSTETLEHAFLRFERAATALERQQGALHAGVERLQREISEIRREEEEEARRRRLEALGRMAAELAHEVRNPLGSIRLFASILIEDLADRPEQRAMVEQILSATSGLESTVSNLLSFAGTGRGPLRRFDLAVVARDACALLSPLCSARGVRLLGPAEAEACPVEADPEGLRQVLLNLLGNALEATGASGAIRVDLSRRGDRVVLGVDDEGSGIAPEDLPRVFDPFSIVQRTVERHGGRVGIESEPGKGTRVRVEIPAQPAVEVGHV
jgi:two-component system sensor histidine kinase HydH